MHNGISPIGTLRYAVVVNVMYQWHKSSLKQIEFYIVCKDVSIGGVLYKPHSSEWGFFEKLYEQ